MSCYAHEVVQCYLKMDLDQLKMYFGNSKATHKNILKYVFIDILKEKIKWNHTKCSIKSREGRRETKKEQVQGMEHITNMVGIF